MSLENVKLVRRMLDALGTGAALDYFDPEVVVINSPDSVDTAPYVGHAGLAAWVRDVRAGAGDFRFEEEETIDVDDTRVLVVGVLRGRGRVSGLPAGNEVTTIFDVRDGLIVTVRGYATRADALAAVDL